MHTFAEMCLCYSLIAFVKNPEAYTAEPTWDKPSVKRVINALSRNIKRVELATDVRVCPIINIERQVQA